jgi:SAM-dependent methyltransferase
MSMNVVTVDRQALSKLGKAVTKPSRAVVTERIAPAPTAVEVSYVQRLNVLITSPADADRERVFKAIADWNGGLGGSDRRVLFVPLMWEKHAISDVDNTPQEAINRQLLNRADLLLAVFRNRLGTPTKDYPAGTLEEIDRRTGCAAVFFSKCPRPNGDEKDGQSQYKRLIAFQKQFKGFAKTYKDADDLADMVRNQLDGWFNELYEKGRIPLIARRGSWTFDNLKTILGYQQKPLNLHIFNSELACFRSPQVFADHWAFLEKFPCIKRVVFLLPKYKVERLRRFLPDLKDGGQETLLKMFSVCTKKEQATTGSGRDRVSSSLAFVLACRSDGVDLNDCLPAADLAILSEPFSSAPKYQDGDLDIQWDYNYYISVNDDAILTTLHKIWREQFDESQLVPLLTLVPGRAKSEKVDRALDEYYKQLSAGRPKNAETSELIKQLRAKLFDPNVPSYLLNSAFELLDWNAAFELIFPTDRFYRGMSVKEFVNCLDNCSVAKERGLLVVKDSTAPVDMEKLHYTSPVFGKMEFTKIASQVTQGVGWIVALNVDKVEQLDVYENALKRTNEEQYLIARYARAAERLLGSFPGYTAIVDAHLQAMKNARARKVLDLGAGPGLLAQQLLDARIAVTSVDNNDDMIEIIQELCGKLPGFSLLKANVERLHAPNDFYDMTKIGIQPPYDGACMVNLYQWLYDPRDLFRRLMREELLLPGALVTISLLGARELLRGVNRLTGRTERADPGESKDFEHFSSLMRHVNDHRPTPSAEVVAEDLKAAGYKVVKQTQVGYEIDGQKFNGFPFLVAEAPHG